MRKKERQMKEARKKKKKKKKKMKRKGNAIEGEGKSFFFLKNKIQYFISPVLQLSFPGGTDSKESACSSGDPGFHSWVRRVPWRRK